MSGSVPALAYSGVWVGRNAQDGETDWDFSVINLTASNVVIGSKPDKGAFGDNFPYGHTYPPGNSQNKTVNLTTWKSHKGNQTFPKVDSTLVNFVIQDGTNQYNFSLKFSIPGSKGEGAYINLQQTASSTWKYTTSVSNDGNSGYSADPPRSGLEEGILYAISDKYVVCLYKPVTMSRGGNRLFLTITQRYPENAYKGYHLQWPMP